MSKVFISARAFALYASWQLVAIIGVLIPALLPVYLLGMVLFILLLILDRRTLLPDNSFSGTLEGPKAPELGNQVQLEATLTLHSSRSLRTDSLRVWAPKSQRIHCLGKFFSKSKDSELPNQVNLRITAKARSLGYEKINKLRLTLRSSIGFWIKLSEFEITPYEFRVSPGLRKMPEQSFTEMVATQRMLFQGSRLLMRGRTVDQFHSIRKYHYPDSIRHLDHKKTAKFGQLMTRTYESYHSHHLILALDVGRAMLGQVRGSPKYDYYLSAGLALAQAGLEAGDRVSFLAFSQSAHLKITKARNARAFQAIYRGDRSLRPREEDSNYAILDTHISEFAGQRAIVLILTDLSHPFVQDSLLAHMPIVCRRHLTVALSLLDRSYDLPTVVDTLGDKRLSKPNFARLLYSYWMNEQLELFGRKMSGLGGGALSISEEYWIQSTSRVYGLLRSSIRV